jgi:hypothetical protein
MATGDSLRRQTWALKPGNSGVFRELSGEAAKAETRWRRERDSNSRYDCFRHLLRLDTAATADTLASLASCRSLLEEQSLHTAVKSPI